MFSEVIFWSDNLLSDQTFGEDHEFQKRLKSEKRLMQELKSVLTVKQEEHEKREAKAIERQKGTSNMQMNDIALPCDAYVSSNQNCDFINRYLI